MRSNLPKQLGSSIIEAICKVQLVSKDDLMAGAPSSCRKLFAPDAKVDWCLVVAFLEWADTVYAVDWKKVGAEFDILSRMPRLKELLWQCSNMKFAYWLAAKWIEQSSSHVLKTVKVETSSNSVIHYAIEVSKGFKPCKPLVLFTAGVLESLPMKLLSNAPATVELSYTEHGINFAITAIEDVSLWAWLRFKLRAVFSNQSLLQELALRQAEIDEKNKLLLDKSNEFRSLIENSPDGVLILDQDVILYVNPRMLNYLKYNADNELIGSSIFNKIVPPESIGVAKLRLAELNSGNGLASPLMEFETLMQNTGERFSCEATAVPITFNSIRCLAVTFRDLSDRKKFQAHLMTTDRMVALGQLAAGVGHEINNPLCYVMMNVDLLVEHLKENNLTSYDRQIARIQKGLERIKSVVGDLKTVSRGTDDEAVKNVDINSVLESVLSMVQHDVQHRAILKYLPTITDPIWIDETRLAQVLLNILINAAHSIPVGHADLNIIEVKTYMNDHHEVVAEIKDSGCGMSPSVQKRIFDPFYTTKPMGSGTGLGLAICQSIVNQFHGAIAVESVEGKGTTFRVSFPAAIIQQGLTSVDDVPVEIKPPATGQVMLIDDDEELLAVIQEVISIKHDCLGFSNASVALDVLKDNQTFDCVICDLMMPKMSGMQFYKALSEHAPYYLNRVIFLTGGSFTEETDVFLKSSEIVYLEKPVDTPTLFLTIQNRIAAAKAGPTFAFKKVG